MRKSGHEMLAAFAGRLKVALAQAGCPEERGQIQQLADLGEVSHPAAQKWIKGEQMPDRKRICLLATKLNVNTEWLETGRGRPEVTSNLSDDEWYVVQQYRKADSRGRNLARMVMEDSGSYK